MCCNLPVYVEVEVNPPEEKTECFIVATLNKRGWGDGGDGLTVCGAVDRCDFDYRYNVFGNFGHHPTVGFQPVTIGPGHSKEVAAIEFNSKVGIVISFVIPFPLGGA